MAKSTGARGNNRAAKVGTASAFAPGLISLLQVSQLALELVDLSGLAVHLTLVLALLILEHAVCATGAVALSTADGIVDSGAHGGTDDDVAQSGWRRNHYRRPVPEAAPEAANYRRRGHHHRRGRHHRRGCHHCCLVDDRGLVNRAWWRWRRPPGRSAAPDATSRLRCLGLGDGREGHHEGGEDGEASAAEAERGRRLNLLRQLRLRRRTGDLEVSARSPQRCGGGTTRRCGEARESRSQQWRTSHPCQENDGQAAAAVHCSTPEGCG
mmetsp:Transcript_39471/g.85946  ORF Transcript_39471/g.85946 Transcript_39471/m.85946 type:complete len:268 (-) Transcript_39471:57-860(-)